MCRPLKERIELFSAEKHFGLAWDFHVSPISCGHHEHYEEYIKLCAATDKASGLGTTHVFITEKDSREYLAGFITLRASSLIMECDGILQGRPALEISELAVDERFAGQSIGRVLVEFTISMADSMNATSVGVRYVVVCSDPQSCGFYKQCHFSELGTLGAVPRENWNNSCVPMYIQLPSAN